MMPLAIDRLEAEWRHQHFNGYVAKRGALFQINVDPNRWVFYDPETGAPGGCQWFDPLKAVILRINAQKKNTLLSDFDIEFPTNQADKKFREVTPFRQPPGVRYVKWYDSNPNKQMYLKSRRTLSRNPVFGFWLIRAAPPSDNSINPTVEIELGANQGTRWRIGLPLAGSQWKYPYLNKSVDGGKTFFTVSEFQAASTQTRRLIQADEEQMMFVFLLGEMFIFLSGESEVWRYKEPGLEIPADYYRVLAQGHVIAFNLSEFGYVMSGSIEESQWRSGHQYHSSISPSATLRDLSHKPEGTTISVSDVGSGGYSRYKVSMSTENDKVTPVLFSVIDERAPQFGPANTSTIDLNTIGSGISEAEWRKDDDGRSGSARLLVKNVPFSTSLPSEGGELRLQAGWEGETGINGLGLDWWGYVESVKIVRSDETLGVRDVEVSGASMARRIGQTLCGLLSINARGYHWASLFKYAGRCAGLTEAQMSVDDDGFMISEDFIIDPSWDVVQLWDELIRLRGDWQWGVDWKGGVIFARKIATTGASVFVVDESATGDKDYIMRIEQHKDIEEFKNYVVVRFKIAEQEMMEILTDEDSVATPNSQRFIGYWKDGQMDIQSNQNAVAALKGLAKIFDKTQSVAVWNTRGKRLDPGEIVTINVSGLGVAVGTQMRIDSVSSKMGEDGFETECLVEMLT
jgi:hypothetical protein